jgi:hypothetical protein
MKNMKRITTIPVLLLAIVMVAASVSAPAAYAVPISGSTSGSLNGGSKPLTTAAATSEDDEDGKGDPGGAGDGLGVDPEVLAIEKANNEGSGAVVEFILQLLRLTQAVG